MILQPNQTIPDHERNNTLIGLGGVMRRKGMSEPAIEAALQITNLERCTPPLEFAEVSGIARSLGRYTPAAPLTTNGFATPIPIDGSSPGSGNRFRDAAISDTALYAMEISKPPSDPRNGCAREHRRCVHA